MTHQSATRRPHSHPPRVGHGFCHAAARATCALLLAAAAATLAAAPLGAQAAEAAAADLRCEPDDREPALYGVVRDASTGTALPGSQVYLRWARASGLADTVRGSREVEADLLGRYRFCDLPAGATVTVWARTLDVPGRTVRFHHRGEGDLRRQVLEVSFGRSEGTVAGRLLEAGTDRPIGAATLTFPALERSALSSADGRFRLVDLPAGTHEAEIQHVAFGRRVVELQVVPGQTLHLELRIEPRPIAVEPIEVSVVAVRPRWLERNGFYDRQARGLGAFVGPEELERQHLQRFSQVLEQMHGVQLVRLCRPHCVFYMRSSTVAGPCQPIMYVDGRKVWLPAVADLDALASAHDLAAVEVYRGISQTPPQFYGRCGSIVVWTKRAAG